MYISAVMSKTSVKVMITTGLLTCELLASTRDAERQAGETANQLMAFTCVATRMAIISA